MTDLIPSVSLDAEQAVLGGLLLANDHWDNISGLLTEHNFYFAVHQHIFQAIQQLLQNNQPADILTVERVLKAQNKLADVGGFAYLAELSKNTPSAANIVAYAEIVRNDSQARQLFALGNELRAEAVKVNSKESLETLIDLTEKKLTTLTFNQADQETVVSVDKALATLLQRMDKSCKHNSLVTGISFGIERLDNNTAGAQNGELIILAARPSMGKTALSLKFAEAALETQSNPVQYFSLEMPAEQIMQRFLAMRARISQQKLRQPITMSDEDMAKLGEQIGYIKEKWTDRLLIDDSSYLTPTLLRTRVRRNARKYGKPSMIIVDYLQLMSDPSINQNKHLEISAISHSLKALAKEMDCPVVALSQVNRNLEQRGDKRPMPSDLRESGSIEQDADVILFIYRDEVYHAESELKDIAEIIISKQRNGPTGTVMSRFRGEFSLFENISDEDYNRLMH